MAQRQADLVEPVEQAMLAERIDFEAHHLGAVPGGDGLRGQIHREAEARKCRAVMEQRVDWNNLPEAPLPPPDATTATTENTP